MTILVTGGTGFIGSHTCVELIDAGYDVVIIDKYISDVKLEELVRTIKDISSNIKIMVIGNEENIPEQISGSGEGGYIKEKITISTKTKVIQSFYPIVPGFIMIFINGVLMDDIDEYQILTNNQIQVMLFYTKSKQASRIGISNQSSCEVFTSKTTKK